MFGVLAVCASCFCEGCFCATLYIRGRQGAIAIHGIPDLYRAVKSLELLTADMSYYGEGIHLADTTYYFVIEDLALFF